MSTDIRNLELFDFSGLGIGSGHHVRVVFRPPHRAVTGNREAVSARTFAGAGRFEELELGRLRIQHTDFFVHAGAPDGSVRMQSKGIAARAAMAFHLPRIGVERRAGIGDIEGLGVVAEPAIVRPVCGPQDALRIDLRIAEALTIGRRRTRRHFHFGEFVILWDRSGSKRPHAPPPSHARRIGSDVMRLRIAARQVESYDAVFHALAGHRVSPADAPFTSSPPGSGWKFDDRYLTILFAS